MPTNNGGGGVDVYLYHTVTDVPAASVTLLHWFGILIPPDYVNDWTASSPDTGQK